MYTFQPHTVVVGRAAILLECAHLVHNCNKGQWPYWLKSSTSKAAGKNKLNKCVFCFILEWNRNHIKYILLTVSLNPQLKRQRLAGKLFYQWAEVSYVKYIQNKYKLHPIIY